MHLKTTLTCTELTRNEHATLTVRFSGIPMLITAEMEGKQD